MPARGFSTKEEAKMLPVLHTKNVCDSDILNVLVVCEDTNVITLLLAIAVYLGQLSQKGQTQKRMSKILDVKQFRGGLSSK